jgi:hypothetical protein
MSCIIEAGQQEDPDLALITLSRLINLVLTAVNDALYVYGLP